VIAGARSLPGQGAANATVESEVRFYAAFYAAYGVAALRVAPRAHRDTTPVRALAGAFLPAGRARAGGWRAAGAPHPVPRALLAAELALPPALVGCQARLSSAAVRRRVGIGVA